MKHLVFLLLICTPALLPAQTMTTQTLHIKKAAGPIRIDGIASEPAWNEAEVATRFWKKFPVDDGPPAWETEVKMLYSDEFLYLSFKAKDSGKAFITSLRRDVGHDANDCVAVMLDPQAEKRRVIFLC